MATAVVTGAASGIGLALARQLAGEGYFVHLADVSPCADVARELGGVSALVDVSDPEQVESLAQASSPAEVVCLNAGVLGASMGVPWEAPPEEWRKVLDVNLAGVVNGLRSFVPRLLADADPSRILVTASLAGVVTFPGGGAYAATKHAVAAVAEQAAMALRDTRVMVTLLCPALVRTAMSETGDDPADVAALGLAASREGRFLVVPPEWSSAVVRRAESMVAGDVPAMPSPAD